MIIIISSIYCYYFVGEGLILFYLRFQPIYCSPSLSFREKEAMFQNILKDNGSYSPHVHTTNSVYNIPGKNTVAKQMNPLLSEIE